MGWMTEESGFDSQLGKRFSSFPYVQTSSGAYPPSYPMGTGNNSLPSSAELKNGGAIPSLPYVFMVWCLIKHMDNFTSYILLNY
jgi:hypothetical protein